MGLQIIAKDKTDGRSQGLPFGGGIRRGLVLRSFMAEDAAHLAINYAPGMPNGEVVGEPTAPGGGTYGHGKGLAHFIQTRIPEPFGATVVIGLKTDDTNADFAHRPQYIGTHLSLPKLTDGALISGLCIRHASSSATLTASANRGTDDVDQVAANVSVAWADHTVWTAFVLEVPPGSGVNTLTNIATGTAAVSVDPAAPRFPSRADLRIFSGYTSNEGLCDIAFISVFDVLLSSGEIADEVGFWQDFQMSEYSRDFT